MKRLWVLTLVMCQPAWIACAGAQRTGLCFTASAPDAPETWRELLLYGYDPKTKEVPRPALDCMGTPLFVQPLDADRCGESGPALQSLPPAPLTDGDVAVGTTPDGKKLVWVKSRQLANGEAVGPVALVEPQGKGWSVRALGTLQAFGENPKLSLQSSGGTSLLVAEGERCDPTKKGTPCARTVRLLPLRGNRFIPEPLSRPEGGCAGAAVFHMYRLETTPQPSGWRREHELTSTLTFGPQLIAVHEQLLVSDRDPKQGDTPPRVIRRAQLDRTVRVEGRRLVTDDESLWMRVFPATAGK